MPNPPIFTYDRFDSSQYSLGIQQQFSFGLQTKLSYQINKTNYINSPLSQSTNLDFTDAKPVLELTLPIWKNGFGRSARAQEDALRYQSEAQQSLSTGQLTDLDIKAEIAYWRCVSAKEAIDVQAKSLQSAEEIERYVSRKASMELGENSDVIQATALVEARKLQLLQAENEARAAAQDLNRMMNVDSSAIPQDMDQIETQKILSISLKSTRPGNRADVDAAQSQTKAAQANSILAGEQVRPSLDLYGSYAMNGRGDDTNSALSDVNTANRDTKIIGIRFTMPLNIGAETDVIRGAKLRTQAADTSYQRALF